MIKEIQLKLLPIEASSEHKIKHLLAREYGINVSEIQAVHILKRSIDARQRTVWIHLKARVFINELPTEEAFRKINYPQVHDKEQVIIVGAGPAGLFAALRLIELGIKPVVIERGKNVHERRKDIARIGKEQIVDPESNYCFGEGGAGAFSDGKLYTRSKKRGSVDKILHVFCQHGANTSILSDAHPHIGTDKLPGIIEKIREQILRSGGEVHFGTRMSELVIEQNEVKGVLADTGIFFPGKVILATGHSARDVYRLLHSKKIKLQSKGIAVGVRLEHPQQLIDQIQYHNRDGRGEYLPAAEYSFTTQVSGRGVYSFCMCPGGFVVPAANDIKQVVVNGMSPSNRGSKWANAGLVVEIHPEDFPEYVKKYEELAVMQFQEDIEFQCFQNGGMKQTAPAQRMTDFVKGKLSGDLPESSYVPGLVSSPLHFWMPEFITSRLKNAFLHFDKTSKGFLTNDAVMIAVESRTSSPVRIIRDKDTYEHVHLQGLFPCGEGAGYAGGIVSAAIDGERCAEAVFNKYFA